jgi:hypothetical protein
MRTVQADGCLNSEQIDTLFISVGGQEGGLGGGSFWAGGPEITRVCRRLQKKMFTRTYDFWAGPP